MDAVKLTAPQRLVLEVLAAAPEGKLVGTRKNSSQHGPPRFVNANAVHRVACLGLARASLKPYAWNSGLEYAITDAGREYLAASVR